MKEKSENKVISSNKKAYFDYEVSDTFEAGIVLRGYEVKSVRAGNVNLKGAFVLVSGVPVISGMHIGPYKAANLTDYDPRGLRRILLKQSEIDKLRRAEGEPGFAIVPLELYLKRGLIKVKIGIMKGKKKYEKREILKRKSNDLDVKRALKHYQ
jgi:SsrA-binding protein